MENNFSHSILDVAKDLSDNSTIALDFYFQKVKNNTINGFVLVQDLKILFTDESYKSLRNKSFVKKLGITLYPLPDLISYIQRIHETRMTQSIISTNRLFIDVFDVRKILQKLTLVNKIKIKWPKTIWDHQVGSTLIPFKQKDPDPELPEVIKEVNTQQLKLFIEQAVWTSSQPALIEQAIERYKEDPVVASKAMNQLKERYEGAVETKFKEEKEPQLIEKLKQELKNKVIEELKQELRESVRQELRREMHKTVYEKLIEENTPLAQVEVERRVAKRLERPPSKSLKFTINGKKQKRALKAPTGPIYDNEKEILENVFKLN